MAPYTPPTRHLRPSSATPIEPNPLSNPAILPDGYPDDVHFWLFGSDEIDEATGDLVHIGGFPHLDRVYTESIMAAMPGWQVVAWGRDGGWGNGSVRIRNSRGEEHLLVGSSIRASGAWEQTIALAALPARVVDALGTLGRDPKPEYGTAILTPTQDAPVAVLPVNVKTDDDHLGTADAPEPLSVELVLARMQRDLAWLVAAAHGVGAVSLQYDKVRKALAAFDADEHGLMTQGELADVVRELLATVERKP